MFFQLVSTSPPSGETIPRPVTTTRRISSLLVFKSGGLQKSERLKRRTAPRRRPRRKRASGGSPGRGAVWARSSQSRRAARCSGLVVLDIVDRVLDGRDLLGRVVRNLDTELLFERHDQFDDVEAVGAEIVDEARFLGHLFGFDAEMLDDDFLHPIRGLAHESSLPFVCWRLP